MNDLEINKALAAAIGWQPEQIIEYDGQSYIGLPVVFNGPGIKLFDHRFTSVIWPIAEYYKCFPSVIVMGKNKGKWMAFLNEHCVTADTAAKAVALVVIWGKA